MLKSSNQSKRAAACCAMVIPGNSMAEEVVVGGLANFFSIYGNLITARIILTWLPPNWQRAGFLQPLYTVCDPFLGIFRGVIPPVFGLDLSPILAITLLQALGTTSVAMSAEVDSQGRPVIKRARRSSFGGIPIVPFAIQCMRNVRGQALKRSQD